MFESCTVLTAQPCCFCVNQVPLVSSMSEPLADDAVSARQVRSFSGSERWSASGSSWDRALGNLVYLLCCSAPAVYRRDFESHRHSVPVERLHALVDALIPICATVMFAKYFTDVGEVQVEQEYEICFAAQEKRRGNTGDDACDVCNAPEFWLFAGTAIVAMVAGTLGVFAFWQKAPAAAREVALFAILVLLIGSGFGYYCHAYNKSQEASFCYVMMIFSLFWGLRAAYRYFVRHSIAERWWQDLHLSHHDGGNNNLQQRQGHEHGQQHIQLQEQVQELHGQQHDEVDAVERQHEKSNYAASIRTTSAGFIFVCACIGALSGIDLSMDGGIFRHTDATCDDEKDGCQWMDIFKVWLTTRSAAQFSVAQQLSSSRIQPRACCAYICAHVHTGDTYRPCLWASLLVCMLELCMRACACVQIMWIGRFDKNDKCELYGHEYTRSPPHQLRPDAD